MSKKPDWVIVRCYDCEHIGFNNGCAYCSKTNNYIACAKSEIEKDCPLEDAK